MAEPILTEKQADVTTITLNRPEAGNRQTDATWAEVTKTIDAAAQDSGNLIQRGRGRFLPRSRGDGPARPGSRSLWRSRTERYDFQSLRRVSQREGSHHRCG